MSWHGILGMNARNQLIARRNHPRATKLVDDKHATKARLAERGIPVPETLLHLRDQLQARRLSPTDLPEQWACKPNKSLGGNGIMLAGARDADDGWRTLSRKPLPFAAVAHHMRLILDGEFSGGSQDTVLVEPLLRPDPDLSRLAVDGLPDIRVICDGPDPVLAMARLPTAASGGRANLHQAAVGAAIDLDTGQIVRALAAGRLVEAHPDSGERLIGARIPHWDVVLDAARRCSDATGLHYLGADVVIDVDRGPLVLEVNARPGLEIQNVHGTGIRDLLSTPTRPTEVI